MVKKSTKSKPKRVTMGEKYTRIRKAKQRLVKEKRKAKKEAKQRVQQGGRKPKRKDPGVPSSWPFKEEFLKEMAFEKAKILAKKKQEKEARLAKRLADKGDDATEESLTPIEALKVQADQKQEEFGTMDPAQNPETTSQGRIDRSFYKEFKKVVELADVVIEVLDARDPLPCRSQEVENFVRSCGAEKRIILLLNKIDLVPRESAEKWLKYLREEMPTVAFKCSTQKQHKHLGQAKKMGLGQKSSTQMCLGAENLLQLLKNYARNKSIKTAITVGIVGMPNVGKSSVINSLKRARVAHVGNRPGVTTSIQEVNLDRQIRLLDSPGIIVSKSQGPLMGCMKTEKLSDPIGVIDEVLRRVSTKKLSTVYHLREFQTADEFLEILAGARGKLRRGGVPDKEAVAKIVLQDWNTGLIPYHTMPPERPQGKAVRLVKEWANDFNMDEISDAQLLGSVKSLKDLEDSMMSSLSNLDVGSVADPQIGTAIESIGSVTLADKGQTDENNNVIQASKRKNQTEPLVFEGANAGFNQMAKRTNDRKDLGNAAKELSGLCMANDSIDSVELGSKQLKEECENENLHKQKKRKVSAGSIPQMPEIPKPRGLVAAEDDEGHDNHHDTSINQATSGKRKKPAKNSSEAQLYGNEGQLNPHKLRADRKKMKKAKRRKQKSAEEASIEASKLADAVLGKVNLDGDMELK